MTARGGPKLQETVRLRMKHAKCRACNFETANPQARKVAELHALHTGHVVDYGAAELVEIDTEQRTQTRKAKQ